MTIAVMKGLFNIAEQLRELGYDVVTYGEYKYPIDAMIYVGESLDKISFSSENVGGGRSGILMINATNKSIEEIHNTLKTRLYSPLF